MIARQKRRRPGGNPGDETSNTTAGQEITALRTHEGKPASESRLWLIYSRNNDPPGREVSPQDIARERRIKQLVNSFESYQNRGRWSVSKWVKGQQVLEQVRQEIGARSPAQVRRIEQARGLG